MVQTFPLQGMYFTIEKDKILNFDEILHLSYPLLYITALAKNMHLKFHISCINMKKCKL